MTQMTEYCYNCKCSYPIEKFTFEVCQDVCDDCYKVRQKYFDLKYKDNMERSL